MCSVPVDMKSIIADTLVSMMKQKGIDKITVKSLIEACDISRQTFYYHFQDIMEVIEWSMEQATQNMLARSLDAKTPQDAFYVLISSVAENRALIRKLLDSQRREQIEKLFVHAARTYLEQLIRSKAQAAPLNYSDMEVALDFWAFGITGLLFKSCECHEMDAKRLAGQICQLLPERPDPGKA